MLLLFNTAGLFSGICLWLLPPQPVHRILVYSLTIPRSCLGLQSEVRQGDMTASLQAGQAHRCLSYCPQTHVFSSCYNTNTCFAHPLLQKKKRRGGQREEVRALGWGSQESGCALEAQGGQAVSGNGIEFGLSSRLLLQHSCGRK